MPAVARLLAREGFTPYQRELHMACAGRFYPPADAALPPGLTVGPGADDYGNSMLIARQGEQAVGECVYSTLATISPDPGAARWGYIWWLHVAEPLRRRGVARHLLGRAMAHLAEQGCRGCWLTTTADNWPAQRLYLALGFEVVDASTCFRADLV
jgi:ribosomal protein S18 acetylase RimI-like enzyme